MRPWSCECEHSPLPRSVLRPTLPPALLGPSSASSSSSEKMSLLQSLGPVQNWLGQELEKCGIDAMVYTRYVLSLLLHDSYDYDLQDQENDIFLGWEKGAGKKWPRTRRKGGSDVSLEEMKKQAAVQCLRSASDETSGIENLVEELCSRLKELQNKQKERGRQTSKKSEGLRSPELAVSPSLKDQLEMYNEAFPPLSEKSVCLQEIMTVWNKDKSCTSFSAAPNTSAETSAAKDCVSDSEVSKYETTKINSTGTSTVTTSVISERIPQKRNKKEKENRQHGISSLLGDERVYQGKKQGRSRSEGTYRPRSCSSGSSEAGSSSSSNQGDHVRRSTSKTTQMRHKSRERGTTRGKKLRSQGQVKLSFKALEKEERRSAVGGPAKQQLPVCSAKKGKRSLKETRKEPCGVELHDGRSKKEFVEEPLWYTEPLTEYFVPLSCRRSKLETTYRNNPDSPTSGDKVEMDRLAEQMQGICFASDGFQRAYLAAGTFVDGHFVELPGEGTEELVDFNRTSYSLQYEESSREDLDDEHLSEFTDFYEVDIYPSMLDPGASDSVQESRILSMIRQKNNEQRESEGECLVLDGPPLHGKSAINTESLVGATGTEGGFLWEDFESIAHVCECYSSSSSGDVDRESFVGDSPPHQLSPSFDNTMFSMCDVSEDSHAAEVAGGDGPHLSTSCFSLFELQCDSPTCCFPCDPITGCRLETTNEAGLDSSGVDPHGNGGKKQSRLLIWTKNSAFDGTEYCSNLSTRTCSPWSHSEETRSDNEQISGPAEELPVITGDEMTSVIPYIPATYLEEDLLDFLKDAAEVPQEQATPTVSKTNVSKLESICGIPLETEEGEQYNTGIFDDANQQNKDYTSGINKDIWTAIGDPTQAEEKPPYEGLLLEDLKDYHCGCNEVKLSGTAHPQASQKKAVQCSVYHLWEEGDAGQELAKNKLSKVESGDYMTPLKPWDTLPDKDSTSFILGGVYGELRSFGGGDHDWAAIPSGNAQGLLQCAAAAAASDVVTIAGTDVFMNTGACFAPGSKPIWRPLVSFGQSDHQGVKRDGLTKGFSFIFHEDLIGTCSGLYGDEPDQDYSFSTFGLSSPFSQVLRVECCFEPNDMTSLSPGFKPKSILCSDSESSSSIFSSRLYGINQTQYRAIRISPRTHFRPISTSELSPGVASESDVESEKEESSLPALVQANVFEDPQADLKPLEEDAECEGPYYGKSELESGKYLPRLKKSGMEKSAQTSLDSQEGSSGALLSVPEQNYAADCQLLAAAAAAVESMSVEMTAEQLSSSDEAQREEPSRTGEALALPHQQGTMVHLDRLHELSILDDKDDERADSQDSDCYWQSSLISPVFSVSQCTGSGTM
ncbi:uncharacterized protein KIAA0232 homolog [Engraulis encrasicolus]|uniref:uncharacterized protein KIAA0232 homolog n=1 Tax=Engraulis encrasicolus TaxID=184585 RepID=UPI002FD6CF0D